MVAGFGFDRFASLEFRDPVGVGFQANPLIGIAPALPGREQLAITFDVEKSIRSVGNKAKVQIHNLAKIRRERLATLVPLVEDFETATAFIDRRLGVAGPGPEASAIAARVGYLKLSAGYDGKALQLFEGDVTHAKSELSGPTWVTSMEATDGGLAINRAIADRTFLEGTPLLEVVRYLVVTCMNLRPSIPLVPGAVNLPQSLASATILGKAVLQGPASQWLDRLSAGFRVRDPATGLLRRAGFGWFVDDGAVTFLDDSGFVPGPPVKIDARIGGLIAEPKRISRNTVEIASRVNGRIRPGVRVLLLSTAVAGTFRVDRVRHTGTNRVGAFRTIALLRNLDPIASL